MRTRFHGSRNESDLKTWALLEAWRGATPPARHGTGLDGQKGGFPRVQLLRSLHRGHEPAAPGSTLELHNQIPLHLTPREGGVEVNLDAWPPLGVTYQMEPIFGVDNDGDGPVDEDTPDEDGDGLIDEDQPGPDPITPGSSFTPSCGDDADCDGTDGEDPPLRYCIQNSLSVCNDDSDGQVDEDPSCVPLMNPSNRHEKSGFCIRDLTLEIAPELPSFSVAPGGPSGLHPADILALTPGDSLSVPTDPLSLVVCNDDTAGLQSK